MTRKSIRMLNGWKMISSFGKLCFKFTFLTEFYQIHSKHSRTKFEGRRQ